MSGTLLVPSESLGDSLWYPIDRLQKNLFKFGLMELTDIFSYSTLWGSLYNSNCVLEFWQAHLMLTEKCQTMSFGSVKPYFSPLVLMSGHSEKRMQELLFLLLESLKSRVRHRHVALKVATNSGDTRRQQAVGNHCTQSPGPQDLQGPSCICAWEWHRRHEFHLQCMPDFSLNSYRSLQ